MTLVIGIHALEWMHRPDDGHTGPGEINSDSGDRYMALVMAVQTLVIVMQTLV